VVTISGRNLTPLHPGERTNSQGRAVQNRILLSIPDSEFQSLRPYLQHIALSRQGVLHDPAEKIQFVYFPNCGLLFLIVQAANGRAVEAGIVGKEGVVGMASAVGLARSPLWEVVQIAGDGFRVAVRRFRTVLRSAPNLQMILSRHAVLHGLQVSQTAACNRLHNTVQRLARWLLMTQDRVDSGWLGITHSFLAIMLGTDRPTVSQAAHQLQKKRAIEYLRGAVRVVNRKRLENAACECYRVVQQWSGELGLK
jgi:CRP-like cAMP-binding protein